MGVRATTAAIDALARIRSTHGSLVLFQSGGCCDGSSPICLPEGELPLSPHDLKLGEVGGAPFYIDGDLYERWNRPAFLLDISPSPPEGFSLGNGDTHFVTRTPGRPLRSPS